MERFASKPTQAMLPFIMMLYTCMYGQIFHSLSIMFNVVVVHDSLHNRPACEEGKKEENPQ